MNTKKPVIANARKRLLKNKVADKESKTEIEIQKEGTQNEIKKEEKSEENKNFIKIDNTTKEDVYQKTENNIGTKTSSLQYSGKQSTKDQIKKPKKAYFNFINNIKKTRKKNVFGKFLDIQSAPDKKNDIYNKTIIPESKMIEDFNKSEIKNTSINEEIPKTKNSLIEINVENEKNIENINNENKENYSGFILIKQVMGKIIFELKIDNSLEELNKILRNKKVVDINNDQLELIYAKDIDKLRNENNKLLEENENLKKELLSFKQKEKNLITKDDLYSPVSNHIPSITDVIPVIKNDEENYYEKREITEPNEKKNDEEKKEIDDIKSRIEKYKRTLRQTVRLTVRLMGKSRKKNISQDNIDYKTSLNKNDDENNNTIDNFKNKSKKVNFIESNNPIKNSLKKKDNIEINNTMHSTIKKNENESKTLDIENKKSKINSRALDRLNRRIKASKQNADKKEKENNEKHNYRRSIEIISMAKELENIYNKNPKEENNNNNDKVIEGNAEEIIDEKPIQRKTIKKPKISSL